MKWQLYGDVNPLEYGGTYVKKDSEIDGYHALVIIGSDEIGEEDKAAVIFCYIDASWYEEPNEAVNNFCGYKKDYVPKTEEEIGSYITDLIRYYGVINFDPDFPKETGCNHYAVGTVNDWIVTKKVAKEFIAEKKKYF